MVVVLEHLDDITPVEVMAAKWAPLEVFDQGLCGHTPLAEIPGLPTI
jgi:hypothetical protein